MGGIRRLGKPFAGSSAYQGAREAGWVRLQGSAQPSPKGNLGALLGMTCSSGPGCLLWECSRASICSLRISQMSVGVYSDVLKESDKGHLHGKDCGAVPGLISR